VESGDAFVSGSEFETLLAEVKLLRADFNGRVRTLELWRAKQEGRWEAQGGFKAVAFSSLALMISGGLLVVAYLAL
jgi:hypothetical protein